MADQNSAKPPNPRTLDISAIVAPEEEPARSEPVETENTGVLRSVLGAVLNLATTALTYALGYWRIAAVSTWVLIPLMACVSVVLDRKRVAGRAKRRRAQVTATADEQTLVTANVSELPSWVFFPDIHRAEWLNQVCIEHVYSGTVA